MIKSWLSQHRLENHCSNLFTTPQVLTLGLPCTLEFFCLPTKATACPGELGTAQSSGPTPVFAVPAQELTCNSLCSVEQGKRPGWAWAPPPLSQPFPGNRGQAQGTAAFQEKQRPPSRAAAQAQPLLTLLCLPEIRELWNGWEGP